MFKFKDLQSTMSFYGQGLLICKTSILYNSTWRHS